MQPRVVSHQTLLQRINPGLDQIEPFETSDGACCLAEALVILNQPVALVQRRLIVADNIEQRLEVPARVDGRACTTVHQGLLCALHDIDENREIVCIAVKVGKERCILLA